MAVAIRSSAPAFQARGAVATSVSTPGHRADAAETTDSAIATSRSPTGTYGIGRAATRSTLPPATAAVTTSRVRSTPARDALEWPRRAMHPDSERTSRTGKLSGKRGYRLLAAQQVGCWTRPELVVWGGAPRRNRTGRPHPYHETTRNRCADRRNRRSRLTVGAEVIGSPWAKLCAHFPITLFASAKLQPAHRTVSGSLSSRSALYFGRCRQSAEQYGSSDHRRTAVSAARSTAAPSTSTRDGGIPRSGHTQMKARGPGGGRGRAR
jgi:hypothetical protein